MTTEQWEIDLRRQLEGKTNNTKPKHQTWEDELAKEIQANPPSVANNENNTTLMMVIFILLGIAMLFAYDSKSGNKVQSWFLSIGSKTGSKISEQPVMVVPKNYDAEIVSLRNDIQKLDADNKEKLDKLTTKAKWNSDRISLMGMLLNENFVIFRNNYNKGHLVFFNRDWTIDQMPHYLELSDEDKEYLKKFVKP